VTEATLRPSPFAPELELERGNRYSFQ
jgi:hypothetical protein